MAKDEMSKDLDDKLMTMQGAYEAGIISSPDLVGITKYLIDFGDFKSLLKEEVAARHWFEIGDKVIGSTFGDELIVLFGPYIPAGRTAPHYIVKATRDSIDTNGAYAEQQQRSANKLDPLISTRIKRTLSHPGGRRRRLDAVENVSEKKTKGKKK